VYARLIRWAFTRFYREFSWTYNTVARIVSLGEWFRWVRAVEPLLAGRTLELGCGTGQLQRRLAGRLPLLVGLDLSRQMLIHTRRALHGRPARLLRADARQLPFYAHRFDTIVATFPSEYILHPATLSEVHRVLAPGGRFVILPSAAFGAANARARLIDLAYRLTLQRSPLKEADTPAQSRFAATIAQAGFRVTERWETVGSNQVQLILAYAADD
jgi:ubiquinone/menaquinone biosynthesis C-methylase UbiE